ARSGCGKRLRRPLLAIGRGHVSQPSLTARPSPESDYNRLFMPAPLARTDVERIAELARLELTPDEVTLFTRQLAYILEYVEQIRGLDTTGVEPTPDTINRPAA